MNNRDRARSRVAALLVIVALVGAACGSEGGGGGDGRLTIVATTTIWGDVVQQIVGDEADVEVLMPIGADPHSYQPSSQQAAMVQAADLVVANGLGLEEGLLDILEAAERDGVNVFEVGPLLEPVPFEEEDHGDATDEEADHDHEGDDPHVWLDPDRVAVAAGLIADELLDIDPEGPWQALANDYISLVALLDEDLSQSFGALPAAGRKMVTSHRSFGYFAERYAFTVIGVVVPGGSTLGDPSSQELSELVDTMREEGVRAIYAETTEPSTLAEAIAAELGEDVTVVELYTGSLGEEANGTDTYIGMMRENARRIVDANS